MYIYEDKCWPSFIWNKDVVNAKLNYVNKKVGYLMGRLSTIGFDTQMSAVVEAVAHDIIASSEIEGVELNNEQVRSSVARKLGVQLTNSIASSHYIDGIVEMALDATTNYATPLTDERLFGWHNCLFPTGWSGATQIDVAQYRKSEMKVVSGMFGREKVHYIAPSAEKITEEILATPCRNYLVRTAEGNTEPLFGRLSRKAYHKELGQACQSFSRHGSLGYKRPCRQECFSSSTKSGT